MLTLSFGFKKPETNDKGDIVFPALEDNIQQLNDHDHNGTNSKKLPSSSIEPLTATLASGSWVATTNDRYRQLVTLPVSLTYDTTTIEARLSSGHVFLPTIEKVSATQFYLYINDNSENVTVLYK
jgi:hypothetical protein